MIADFLAGFFSGLGGLIIGSPLDVLKTIKQNSDSANDGHPILLRPNLWFSGLLMPIMSLGFLNGILFWSYNMAMLDNSVRKGELYNLMNCFFAGAFAGLCVCFISIPTEAVKVRAQVLRIGSMEVVSQIMQNDGFSGLYRGSLITIVRDVIGYAFYFAAYELFCLLMPRYLPKPLDLLTAGGLAGCVSWLSIFPLDTIKTNIQADRAAIATPLIIDHCSGATAETVPWRAIMMTREQQCAKDIYQLHGLTGFFNGLTEAMVRAFCVNAVIFWLEKRIRQALGGG